MRLLDGLGLWACRHAVLDPLAQGVDVQRSGHAVAFLGAFHEDEGRNAPDSESLLEAGRLKRELDGFRDAIRFEAPAD